MKRPESERAMGVSSDTATPFACRTASAPPLLQLPENVPALRVDEQEPALIGVHARIPHRLGGLELELESATGGIVDLDVPPAP